MSLSIAEPRVLWRKALLGASAVTLAAFGLIGFAHTEAGRPLLAFLPGMEAACPVSANADPAVVEKFRVAQLQKRDGEREAGGVPALGFELGKTTRAQVDAWIAARDAQCKSEREDTVLRCLDVRPATETEAPIDDLFLQFDARKRLVAVDAQRGGLTGAPAVAHLDQVAGRLGQVVGPPTKTSGNRDPAYLDAHPFARVEVQYGYRGYLAQLSAMNFGKGQVRVREQYQWMPP
jgi:hypothetical protein